MIAQTQKTVQLSSVQIIPGTAKRPTVVVSTRKDGTALRLSID